MNEELVEQNVIDVADGEPFRHRLDELDGGEGVEEREGLGERRQEQWNHLACLRGVEIGVEKTENVLVGHHTHCTEENEQGYRLADKRDRYN